MNAHLLATEAGLRLFQQTITAQAIWSSLTPAQRRTLLDPGSGTTRPAMHLEHIGLLRNGTVTVWGAFVLKVGDR